MLRGARIWRGTHISHGQVVLPLALRFHASNQLSGAPAGDACHLREGPPAGLVKIRPPPKSMSSLRAWPSTGTVQSGGAHSARQLARAWAAFGTHRSSNFSARTPQPPERARATRSSAALPPAGVGGCSCPTARRHVRLLAVRSACDRVALLVFWSATDASLPRSPHRLRAQARAGPSQRQLGCSAQEFGLRFRCVARARGRRRGAGRWRGMPGLACAGPARGRAPLLATCEPRRGRVAARVKHACFTFTRCVRASHLLVLRLEQRLEEASGPLFF